MFEALLGTLKAGLSIWEHKEARKYITKVIKLEKEWYEIYNSHPRDNAMLDNVEFELRLISKAFSSSVKPKS